MRIFNQKIFTYALGLVIAIFLSLFFNGSAPRSISEMEINRAPAQFSYSQDPFIIHYLNYRTSCLADWSSCAQASDCASSLCLRGSCVARYFSTEKANAGQSCSSRDQCYSNVCDVAEQKCVGSNTNLCAYVGQFCNADTQCCSGTCDTNAHECIGDSVKECGPNGAIGSSTECCSGVAAGFSLPGENTSGQQRCVGSSVNPGGAGDLCNADTQCLSNVCDRARQRCQ